MKEPILQDKRLQHVKFCKCASELIESVLGKPQNASIEASLERIRKADVVAQTKIIYQEKELLQLIHDHLLAKGLQGAAEYLQREAELPGCSILPPCPIMHAGVTVSASSLLTSPKTVRHHAVTSTMTPQSSHHGNHKPVCSTPTGGGPVKLNIINCKTPQPVSHARTQKIIQAKNDCVSNYYHQSPLSSSSTLAKKVTGTMCHEPSVSLDEIITEYLRKQHASCTNPVVTCPPFSLLTPHRCPDPQHKNTAPCNFTTRLLRRSVYARHGGPSGEKLNRKFIYSRFRPVRTYSDSEEDRCFSCCAFSLSGPFIMMGTYAGELKLFNAETSEETEAYACHTSPLTQCQPSKDGSLVLTSSSWGRPLSALWGIGNSFELKQGFNDDHYVEFSKLVQDKVVGTKEATAYIYDVSTGRQILTLYDARRANNYSQNKATFNPTDDLVLSDGVLWDIHTGHSIHKFDKFNPNISGVFHPNSLEIVINSEVWDLRTFRLLHTVPALDQCHIRFNNAGTVIYGAMHHMDDDAQSDDGKLKSPFGSAFRTFDSQDYSNIATVDVKRNIFDLCTDPTDCYLAVIENTSSPETLADESVCRLYEVGLLKDEDDDQVRERLNQPPALSHCIHNHKLFISASTRQSC
ncbi:hypothetical protein NP493_452g02036 [Ridgeia piscesae]|uniref:DDB1- and CUL4-associated factor 1 n=1 Tax=Ridgeia piscesae TaxID=27915 RepID=A0AAD9KYX2_RIDPI|nr:hypothetical protein NP493_452g02036 [Ridgeia piscesae]